MKKGINLQVLLSQEHDPRQRIASFALLCLGTIDSLVAGTIRVNDAIPLFFHANNCLFVQEHLQEKVADEVMSRGVQLPDLFDALPNGEAQQEYQRELALMHSLCLKLIEEQRIAA